MDNLSYFIGIDLGQTTDFTALCILERPKLLHPKDLDSAYTMRHLERFPLGTPYPDIVRQVIRMLQLPKLRGALVAIDQTGVGRAVVDMFRETMRGHVVCNFRPITISSGHQVNVNEGKITVPKKELVSTLQVLLQSRRLHIARSLAHADILVRELENFRVKITPAGNETFEAWRENIHDDLVLAVALAGWVAEQGLAGRRRTMRQAGR